MAKYGSDIVSSQTYYEAAAEIAKISDEISALAKESFTEENANNKDDGKHENKKTQSPEHKINQ